MARRLPPCHCPEWLATVEDIGQIYGWWLGEVELTFDSLSTLPLSVYPWREDSHHAIAQSGWWLPLPRVAGDCKTLPLSVYPWREDSHHAIAQSGWRLPLPRVAGDI